MGFTEYVGARYVPIFGRLGEETIEWDNTKPYEPLTIVLHEGNSFTSRQYVPVGIGIDNKEYWAETGNYNAQVEQYRQEVLRFTDSIVEKSFAFETVAEMKNAENLYVGAICHTNGFYESGDDGDGWYIVNSSNEPNEMDVISINSNLSASLIYDNEVKANQIGLKNDNQFDNTHILESFINSHKYITIKFSKGVYRFSPFTLTHESDSNDDGAIAFIGCRESFPILRTRNHVVTPDNMIIQSMKNTTIFAPISNQTYIMKFDKCWNILLKNIVFSTISNISHANDPSQIFVCSEAMLYLYGVCHSTFDNINFILGIGRCAIRIDNNWECTWTDINIRGFIATGTPTERGAVEFNGTVTARVNCSALHFTNWNVEYVSCNWFLFNGVRVQNTTFNGLLGEISQIDFEGNDFAPIVHATKYDWWTAPFTEVNRTLAVFASINCDVGVFNVNCTDLSIDNFGSRVYTINGNDYRFCSIVSTYDDSAITIAIDSISISEIYIHTYIYSGSNEIKGHKKSVFVNSVSYGQALPVPANTEVKYMRGTLTSCKFPNIPQTIGGVGTFHNNIQELLNIAPYEGTMDTSAGANRIYTRLFIGDSSAERWIARLPITWDENGTVPKLKDRIVAAIGHTGYKKIIVVANAGSEIEVKYSTSESEFAGEASVTDGNLYKTFELEKPYSLASAGSFVVLSGNHEGDKVYRIILQ